MAMMAIYGTSQELDFNQGRLRKIEGLEGLVNLKVRLGYHSVRLRPDPNRSCACGRI